MSACNHGQPFVTDLRGSSAFFAAGRPYVFPQVGKAGVQLLYHWDFDADAQFGEVNGANGQTQLSYWVDYWLAQMFPAGAGQQSHQHNKTPGGMPVMNRTEPCHPGVKPRRSLCERQQRQRTEGDSHATRASHPPPRW
jgi:hypothetical protein